MQYIDEGAEKENDWSKASRNVTCDISHEFLGISFACHLDTQTIINGETIA